MHSRIRRTITTAVKVLLAGSILLYLGFKGRDAFAQLSAKSINWWMMAAALVVTLLMAGFSFVRWHILIRALGIDARLLETMRLGALGFALNFVAPGSIGGDFFKAIFLAHGHPERRPEAIATVVADRVLGLLTMLLLASTGILLSGLLHTSSHSLKILYEMILVMSAVLWLVCILLVLFGSLTGPRVTRLVEMIPIGGKAIARMLATVQVYRLRKRMLVAAMIASIAMASCFVASYWLVSVGLPIEAPSFQQHMLIVPIAGIVGTIPLTPSGLGTTELAIEKLYQKMPGVKSMVGDGTLVGIGRRMTDIAVALIGLAFYLANRKEVDEVFAEAEQVAETE